jgi:hypothetical protein
VRYNPFVGIGLNGEPYGESYCTTVTGMNGTNGSTELQPCIVPQDPTQTWHEHVVISSAYTVTGIVSNTQLVSAVMGRLSALKRSSECLQGDGTVAACANTPNQLLSEYPFGE